MTNKDKVKEITVEEYKTKSSLKKTKGLYVVFSLFSIVFVGIFIGTMDMLFLYLSLGTLVLSWIFKIINNILKRRS